MHLVLVIICLELFFFSPTYPSRSLYTGGVLHLYIPFPDGQIHSGETFSLVRRAGCPGWVGGGRFYQGSFVTGAAHLSPITPGAARHRLHHGSRCRRRVFRAGGLIRLGAAVQGRVTRAAAADLGDRSVSGASPDGIGSPSVPGSDRPMDGVRSLSQSDNARATLPEVTHSQHAACTERPSTMVRCSEC